MTLVPWLWWMLAPALAAPAAGLVELTPMESGRPTILVLRKATPNMDTFVEGLQGELQAEFNLVSLDVGRTSSVNEVAGALASARPDAVVLLDNPTAELYRQYQELNAGGPQPPAVIAMALFVEQTAARLRNATGIAYEVPAVTSFVRLRTAITKPVARIGVIHRPAFATFVSDQARLASIEGFEIVPIPVKQRPGVGQVRKSLKALDQLGVDALWVLNDNLLLTPEILMGAWLPMMRRNARPVVVGVSNLLRTDPPIGSFAVLPDHQSLGMQTADLIYDLHEAGWAVADAPPQLPIAVETVMNRTFMERTVGLRQGALDEVDEVVE